MDEFSRSSTDVLSRLGSLADFAQAAFLIYLNPRICMNNVCDERLNLDKAN